MKPAQPTHCEGMRCSIRETCARHNPDEHQRYLLADYSQVVSFKPAVPSACEMFKVKKNG